MLFVVCSCTVEGDKLAAFVQIEVVGRQKRRGKKEDVEGTVGHETILLICVTVKKLWIYQRTNGMYNKPDFGNSLVKSILETASLNEHTRFRKAFEDPGVGTIMDGYTIHIERNQLSNHFFEKNNDTSLRDRLAVLLCHAALLQGDNARKLEVSKLQCHIILLLEAAIHVV